MATTISQIVSRILHFDLLSSFSEDAKSVLLYSFLSQAHDGVSLVATEAELWRVLDRPLVFTRWDAVYDSALELAREFRTYVRVDTPSEASGAMWKPSAVVFYDVEEAPDATRRVLVGRRVPVDLSLPELSRVVLDWRVSLAEKFLFLVSLLWPHGGTHAAGLRRTSNTSPYLQRFVSLFVTKVEDERFPRGFRFTCRDPIFEMLRLFDPFVDFASVKHHYETRSVSSVGPSSTSGFGSYAAQLKNPGLKTSVASSKLHRGSEFVFFAWLPWHLAEALGIRHEGDKLALMRRGFRAILSELNEPGSVVSNNFSLPFLRGATAVVGEEYTSTAESVYAAMCPLTIHSMLIRGVSCNYRDHAATDSVDRWAQSLMEICKWIYVSRQPAGEKHDASGSEEEESTPRRSLNALLLQLRRILRDPLLPCVINSALKWITELKVDDYRRSHGSGEVESKAAKVVRVVPMSAIGFQRSVAMNQTVRDHVLIQRLGGEFSSFRFVSFSGVPANAVSSRLKLLQPFMQVLRGGSVDSGAAWDVQVMDAHVDGQFSAVAAFRDSLDFHIVQSLLVSELFLSEVAVSGLFAFHEAATVSDGHRYRTAVFFASLMLRGALESVGPKRVATSASSGRGFQVEASGSSTGSRASVCAREGSYATVAHPLDAISACISTLFGSKLSLLASLMYPGHGDGVSVPSDFKTRQWVFVRGVVSMLPGLLWRARGREWSDAVHLVDSTGAALFPRSVFSSPRAVCVVAWVVLFLGMRSERGKLLVNRDQAAMFLCRAAEGPGLKSLSKRLVEGKPFAGNLDLRLPNLYFTDSPQTDLRHCVHIDDVDRAELCEWILANPNSPTLWTVLSCFSVSVPVSRQQFTQLFGVLPPHAAVDAKVLVWAMLHAGIEDSRSFKLLSAPLSSVAAVVSDDALQAHVALCFALAGTNLHVWMKAEWAGRQKDCLERTSAMVKEGTLVATAGYLHSSLEPLAFAAMSVPYSNGSALSPFFDSFLEENFPGVPVESALPSAARSMLADLVRPVVPVVDFRTAPLEMAPMTSPTVRPSKRAFPGFPDCKAARSPKITAASWADADDAVSDFENNYVPL